MNEMFVGNCFSVEPVIDHCSFSAMSS